MKHYIIDIKGDVYAETDGKEKAEALLATIIDEHPEYNNIDLEIVTDADEENLVAELREMAALGWSRQEAYDSKEDFLDRIGEVGEGFTEEEIFQTWENVWEQIKEETEG